MHHDIQKVFSYHNFYLFFPICKRKEFELFQLLENFEKKVVMHRPVAKDHHHEFPNPNFTKKHQSLSCLF